MDPISTHLILGASGVSSEKTYVEDVFSTYLYKGNDGTQAIDNGIDLSTEGGLVIIKSRNANQDGVFMDTARGLTKSLYPSDTSSEHTASGATEGLSSFNSNGFTAKLYQGNAGINNSANNNVSWTFRKAKGFFDIQEYAGDGNDNKVITHDLGSVPGCIIIKNLDSNYGWYVYHRSLNGGTNPEQYFLRLDTNGVEATSTGLTDEAPTATQFKLGDNVFTNKNGDNYIAYIFAHDEESFGKNADSNIIKCAGYTGNGNTTQYIDVGFEPQWLMIKRTNSSENWYIFNTLGPDWPWDQNSNFLEANTSDSENYYGMQVYPHRNGFYLHQDNDGWNANNSKYIYVAIRRPDAGVGKTPEAGTDVFAMDTGDATASNGPDWDAPFPVDMTIITEPGSTQNRWLGLRSTGNQAGYVQSDSTFGGVTGMYKWDHSDGIGGDGYGTSYQAWMWKRAPGFFDCQTWTGTGGDAWFDHGLGVVPEMMWFKSLDNGGDYDDWIVYHKDLYFTANSGNTGWPGRKYIKLNSSDAQSAGSLGVWNYTEPTATQFKLGGELNVSGDEMMICLFASLTGVSKVGMYEATSPAANRVITTGFQPRFVLIKRIDGSGEWMMMDSLRGITNKRLELNTMDAQTTDTALSVQSDGFTVTEQGDSEFNGSDGSKYLYYAIA